jgi:hypothetical protein
MQGLQEVVLRAARVRLPESIIQLRQLDKKQFQQ